MVVPKNVRASDRPELSNPQGQDFIVRRRFPSVRQMAQLCLASVIVVLGVTLLVRNDTLLGSLMCMLVGSIMLYLGRNIEKQQKVVNATEFMNALFSCALCHGYKFCMIVRQDGEIMYLDRGFQEIFPDFMGQPKRNLEALIQTQSLPDDTANALKRALATPKDDHFAITVASGSNKVVQALSIQSEPISRPKGYVLLRGK